MDTDELRRAFTLSASIFEQIRSFRSERVALISKGESPVQVMSGRNLILHLIPVSSFRSRQLFDVATMPNLATRFAPLGVNGWDSRLNLDGHLSFAGDAQRVSNSYTQFFRNGAIEAVISGVVNENNNGGKWLRAEYYERVLVGGVPQLLSGLRQVGVQPPVWCFLTITGVKGAKIPTDSDFGDEYRAIDRDVLTLPEFVIDNLDNDAVALLRPTFDLVWNASGFRRSFNFDEKGNWVGRRG